MAISAVEPAADDADRGALIDGDDAERFAVSVDISVIAQHIAARIAAWCGVVQASGFGGRVDIVLRDRGVVAALNIDVQRGAIGCTGRIHHLVTE
ncbi:hypothetical protein D3C87_1248400 [compost metagenome]